MSLDRRTVKCASEHYVKERKSNAVKQFSYNKLVNDHNKKQQTLQAKQKQLNKPVRPPAPKSSNSNEGVLIDFSPEDGNFQMQLNLVGQVRHTNPEFSILDEPIDVPTEGAEDDFEQPQIAQEISKYQPFQLQAFESPRSEIKIQPPPYQMPPKYTNTSEIVYRLPPPPSSTSLSNQRQLAITNYASEGRNPSPQPVVDPFDTTHVGHYNNINTVLTAAEIANSLSHEEQIYQNYSGKNSSSLHVKTSSEDLSDLTNRMLASMSPKHTTLANIQSIEATNYSRHPNDNTHLSDSLAVNLSSITLDESNTGSNEPTPSNNRISLNKSFLAELEKDMYKNERSSVNNSQNFNNLKSNNKENTVNAINSNTTSSICNNNNNTLTPYIQTQYMNQSQISSQSTKMTNLTNFNQPSSLSTASPTTSSNYDLNVNYANNLILKNKNYDMTSNIQQKPSNLDTTSVINQIWLNKNEIGAGSSTSLNSSPQKSHNFVAISNRQQQQVQSQQQQIYSQASQHYNSLYNSVPDNIYSDIYDAVASTPASILYAPVDGIVGSGAGGGIGNSNSNSIYNNFTGQSVIYDEVTNDDFLRPHRPAPQAPTGASVLSAQQIQRRLEKIAQHTELVTAVLAELGDDAATDADARRALEAVNWDQKLAVRHYKIEQLFRYVVF